MAELGIKFDSRQMDQISFYLCDINFTDIELHILFIGAWSIRLLFL